jgi:phage gpG-like protein
MNIEISGVEEAMARIGAAELLRRVARGIHDANQLAVAHISMRKLSSKGPTTLAVQSDRLRSSVRSTEPQIVGTSVLSSLGSNVKYAGVHEYGTGPYTIRARNGKALRWGTPSGIRFARTVRHPGHPARRMFASGVEEKLGAYERLIAEEVAK